MRAGHPEKMCGTHVTERSFTLSLLSHAHPFYLSLSNRTKRRARGEPRPSSTSVGRARKPWLRAALSRPSAAKSTSPPSNKLGSGRAAFAHAPNRPPHPATATLTGASSQAHWKPSQRARSTCWWAQRRTSMMAGCGGGHTLTIFAAIEYQVLSFFLCCAPAVVVRNLDLAWNMEGAGGAWGQDSGVTASSEFVRGETSSVGRRTHPPSNACAPQGARSPGDWI